MSGLWLISYIALWILFLVVALLLISVLYHLGIIYNRIDKRSAPATKLTAGKPLPDVVLQTLDGNQIRTSQFHGSQSAFVVISPGCSGCVRVLKALAAGEKVVESPLLHTVIVSMRDISATLEMVRQVRLPEDYLVLVDTQNIVERAWGVRMTPVIVEVDNEHKISRQTVFLGAN